MQIRYQTWHRSISAGQVDSMLLLMAGKFPRLNERGSIEGRVSFRLVSRFAAAFPRLNERGSIEASLSLRARRAGT